MQNIYETFEFNKIKDSIKEFSKTELGGEYIDNLKMLENYADIKESLDDLNEFISVITRYGEFPIQTSANAMFLINIAKKTSLLTPKDLSLIALDVSTCKRIYQYIAKIGDNYPKIKNKISGFYDLSSLEKEINRVITNALTINDNASTLLKELRGKIKKYEASLNQKIASIALTYSSYLNDDNATIRDGHFVLPVKTSDKSKVNGIVYDVSDSGNTTFIEPLEIVEINNQITSLKVEENEECRRILKELTCLVLLQENEILCNNKIIGLIDFYSAKAKYALSIDAVVSDFEDKKQVIELTNAAHPLISKDKVIKNTYILDEDKRIVIISGPNAGGKTVSLKTVGLLVLMNQCGLAIPCSKANLSFFKNIYIDIGDNQSLSDNLSTFSAHMSHISEIVSFAKGKDLILLDELGTGTDPKEGEALALSTTKFLEKTHCFAMISSHFDALKEYAFVSDNLENSCMLFDEEKLLPTYRFKLGTPGHSYALDVANRYGLPSIILEDAKEYLSSKNVSDVTSLILTLQNKVIENTKISDELERERKYISASKKQIEIDTINLKNRKENLLKDVEKEKQILLEETENKIEEIMKVLSKGDLKLHEVIKIKKNVDDLYNRPDVIIYNEEISVNDYVSVPSLNINGRVTRINGKKAHVDSDNSMSFDIDLEKLHKIDRSNMSSTKQRQYLNTDNQIKPSVGLELNIIGYHFDEGLSALEKYIDDCRLKHFSSVRIIHGFGSGTLRKMTHEYLSKQKDLTYRLGDGSEGGSGATVVIFNKSKNEN